MFIFCYYFKSILRFVIFSSNSLIYFRLSFSIIIIFLIVLFTIKTLFSNSFLLIYNFIFSISLSFFFTTINSSGFSILHSFAVFINFARISSNLLILFSLACNSPSFTLIFLFIESYSLNNLSYSSNFFL